MFYAVCKIASRHRLVRARSVFIALLRRLFPKPLDGVRPDFGGSFQTELLVDGVAEGAPVGQAADLKAGIRQHMGAAAANRAARVNPDIVHGHALRKSGGAVGVPRPTATDGNVQQKRFRLGKDPLSATGNIGGPDGKVELAVRIPADTVGLPLDCKDVKIISEGCSSAKHIRPANAFTARIAWSMDRAMHRGRFTTDVFHDVNFPADRPAHRVNVRAQHPESRPKSLAARYFNARLDAAIGPRPLALG